MAGLILASYAYYQYNKSPLSLKNKSADISISAVKLLQEYESDESMADSKFLDKVLEVSGSFNKYEEIDGKANIYFESKDKLSNVICEMENTDNIKSLVKGQTINIKGLCSGYLMDVILVKSVIN